VEKLSLGVVDPLAASGKTKCSIAKDASSSSAKFGFTDASEEFGEGGIPSGLAAAASCEAAGDGVVKWGDPYASFLGEKNPPSGESKAVDFPSMAEMGFEWEDPLPFSWYFTWFRVWKSTSLTVVG